MPAGLCQSSSDQSSWLVRHAAYYGVTGSFFAEWLMLGIRNLSVLDHRLGLARVACLSEKLRCDPVTLIAMTFVDAPGRSAELICRGRATQKCRSVRRSACARRRLRRGPETLAESLACHLPRLQRAPFGHERAPRRPRDLARHQPLRAPVVGSAELVSAAPLAIEPFLKLDLRDRPGRVQADPLMPRAPYAAPPAHKRQILEERWFDREDVESGHVLGAVDPFEHENLKKGRVVRVRGHGPNLRSKNSLASNKGSESMASLRFRLRIDSRSARPRNEAIWRVLEVTK